MTVSKGQVAANNNILGQTGLNGATITGLSVWRQGNVDVIEIAFTGGTATSPYYLKTRNGQNEIGGDPSWGSGTRP